MPEENHHEEHHSHEEHKVKMPFNYKVTKWDVIGAAIAVVILSLMILPQYVPKDGCEVARPDNKCDTVVNVMTEHCTYWGNFSCNTASDVSLTQVEWYIADMCKLQNEYHGTGLDCANLKSACNQISGKQLCPL
jgi:hypothetical protein